MNNTPAKTTAERDFQLEQALGRLLRAGVMISAALVALGAVIYLSREGNQLSQFSTFTGQPPRLRTPSVVIRESLQGRGRSLMMFGILILLATPVVRVGLSVIGFFREKDWLYVGMTLFVFAILMYSLLG